MGLGAFILTFVGAPLIGATIMAGVYQAFLRETTGIFERWGSDQTIEQQEALIAAAAAIDIDPNLSGREDASLTGADNHDQDCLTNEEELNLGLDPRNPDTDGDGVDDCIEISSETDPNDPNDGGIGPVSDPTIVDGPGQLYLDNIIKTVNGKHQVTVEMGATVSFHIHVDAFVDGSGDFNIIVKDPLPAGLRFIEGRLGESGQTFTTYPGEWTFNLGSGSNQIDIFFTAEVMTSGTITNTATAQDQNNSLNQTHDTAYINVAGPNAPPPPVITYLQKQGRLAGTDRWFHYVFAKDSSEIEFRIATQVNTENAKLIDQLPAGLGYQSQSISLYHNGEAVEATETELATVFAGGLTLGQGPGEYELRFRVKVGGPTPFAYTNSATLTAGNAKLSSTSIVTSR